MNTFVKTLNNLTNGADYAAGYLRHGRIENNPVLANVPEVLRQKVARRICFVRPAGFCYFRIPKSANSTIVMSLYENLEHKPRWPVIAPDDSLQTAGTVKRLLRGLPSLADLPGLFTFTIVRHPVSRVLSAYLDKMLGAKHPCLGYKPGTRDGFHYFLAALEDNALRDNIHWAPQTEILPWGYRNYNFIGKFENLDHDLNYCLERIYGPGAKIRSARRHQTDAGKLARSFIDRNTEARIERLYSADYEAFYPDPAG